MIDPKMFEGFSFRIPTSGPVSTSKCKVVGILPNNAGDLIVVPSNLLPQKGLDFDVDKENLYQYWSSI